MTLTRLTLTAAVAIAAAQVFAQTPKQQPVFPVGDKSVQTVRATSIIMLDGQGRYASPEMATPIVLGRDVPVWATAWDSTNTNPATQVSYSNYYGVDAGPLAFADQSRAFGWLNDIRPDPGLAGAIARRVRVGLVWNPAGTNPRSGTAGLAIRVFATQTFDDTAFGPAYSGNLNGVEARFPNQPAGILDLVIDLPAGYGMPIPRIDPGMFGGLAVNVGTISNNAFQFLNASATSIAASPVLNNLNAPADPQFPGTNISRSTDLQWDDDTTPVSGLPQSNLPNNVFDDFSNSGSPGYSELYGYDYTLDNLGILQAAVGLFVDTTAPTLTGSVVLPSGPTEPPVVLVDVRNGSTPFQLLANWRTPLSSSGQFVILNPLTTVGGPLQISVKAPYYLRKRLSVTVPAGSATLPTFALVPGDCDDDNDVDIDDYDVLANAYGTFEGDAAYTTAADLDHDGDVDIDDYDVLATNYGQFGDDL